MFARLGVQHIPRAAPRVAKFSSVARQRPYLLRDLPNGITEVLLGPKSLPMGQFTTEKKQLIAPGFVLEPNPHTEPEVLVQIPTLFEENHEFFRQLDTIFTKNIHNDPTYGDLVAGETKTKFYHIYDFRLPPLFGRIPEVEDILGTVELDLAKDYTKIVPESFAMNPMYRPVTRYGATLISNGMFDLLKQELKRA